MRKFNMGGTLAQVAFAYLMISLPLTEALTVCGRTYLDASCLSPSSSAICDTASPTACISGLPFGASSIATCVSGGVEYAAGEGNTCSGAGSTLLAQSGQVHFSVSRLMFSDKVLVRKCS
jgi:hypothetical protein